MKAGAIKIPVFQRDFVWKPQQMLELFDSILKGYPIGSLLLWSPNAEFKTREYIGPYHVKKTSRDLKYVLDGFQRLSTLFGCLVNPDDYAENEKLIGAKEFNIFYNLSDREFTYIKNNHEKRYYYMPLHRIVDTFEFLDFVKELESNILDKSESTRLIENAKEISKTFYDYEIPFVEIRGGDIKSAVEIFSRINSTGTEISQDFMLSALSYNPDTNFLFSEAITEFLNKLSIYNFENLKRDTVLNCISTSRNKVHFDVKVEDLLKHDLEYLTFTSFEHIEMAVHFLHKHLKVWDVRLLPYPTQLIFIADFFRINKNPSFKNVENLKKWFWITSYSNYFTIYSLSQQRAAYKRFLNFAQGKHEDGILKIVENFESAKFPEKINFTGVRTKTLQLFMINHAYDEMDMDVGERLREVFVASQKERTPGNIILRASSDYEMHSSEKNLHNFVELEDTTTLERFFITPELVYLYRANKIDEFIRLRESIIQSSERKFVRELGINYSGYETLDLY
ncbi:hypothetical protein ADIARSV_0544 [Arcticibacter svalbardensis MN12-7]|uniref:GmrSD restriction endonucleases N-terminal domain-containing protein n=2 Tax=Arcticibacter TaxID=1288026 RepID=R9H555_9SPHI|nr:hypothetical protein ADIARSV_0544 [Arcticibacter svalbardensis MN12-7]